jgi:ferritin
MASWCELTGYDGSAEMLYQQADEERPHMLKIIRYLNGVGIPGIVPAIKQPPSSFKTLESTFKIALKNEQAVTASFNKIADLAQKEKDHSTFGFLQWFVNEQVEEEKKFETILQKFDLLGRDKIAVYEIDKLIRSMSPEDSVQE